MTKCPKSFDYCLLLKRIYPFLDPIKLAKPKSNRFFGLIDSAFPFFEFACKVTLNCKFNRKSVQCHYFTPW